MTDRRIDAFFYGLFMDVDVLRESKVAPSNPRRAYVADFALRIGQRATLLPAAGARAYGMLIALTHRELERLYLGLWSEVPRGRGFTAPGRQILHCTYGSVLTDPELGPALRGVLEAHLGTYEEVLAEHFDRHLEALKAGM